VDVPAASAVGYGLDVMDSVYSYRSATYDTQQELQYMLDNERFNPLSSHDTGHEFWNQKYYVKNTSIYGKQNFMINVPGAGSSVDVLYRGPIGLFRVYSIPNTNPLWAPYSKVAFANAIPKPDLVSLGPKAIHGAAPARSHASLAVALMELRDGLPKIPGMALKNTKKVRNTHGSLGDEYLNLVFGWSPAIGDIKSILTAMVNAGKILNQYSRDSDHFVRRHLFFPEEKSTTLYQGTGIQLGATPSFPDANSNVSPGVVNVSGSNGIKYTDGKGGISLVYTETTKTWFSGAYRYHLDNGPDLFSRITRTAQQAGQLLGARLDPASLWQAMPWSWLIDWFTDIGDIIANGTNSTFDGQVLQYGYLMRTTTRTATISTDAPVAARQPSGDFQNVGILTTTFVSQRKDRIRATPFGFGLNPNSFSAQQWAVLGALGMTRTPRSLH